MSDLTLPQTIPVLDLSQGQAVHAVRGRRLEYRPLASVFAPGSCPFDLAQAILRDGGFAEFYVADLDAIQSARPQFELLERLLTLPPRWLMDLGIRNESDLRTAQRRLDAEDIRFVVATETCENLDELRRIGAGSRPESLALGLDFLRGEFRTREGAGETTPEDWMNAARLAGVDCVVALDLDRVGSDAGFALPGDLGESPAFRAFANRISGGGIRSIDDLTGARAAGCDGALVGSALHDGRLSPRELHRER